MADLPGVPMPSGFDYRPYEDCPEIHLSQEAKEEIWAIMDSVNEALRRAQESAGQYVVG
jgi:hypothetical protein